MVAESPVADAIRAAFSDAGVRGWLHARPVRAPRSGAREVGVGPDDVVPLASVYKLPLLAAFCRAVDDGVLDPGARTTLRPETRPGGAAGIAIMRDAVTISWRDLAASMISVSDNAAADALYSRIGRARIEATTQALGLPNTVVQGNSQAELATLLARTGTRSADAAFLALADNDRPLEAGYRALGGSASSPREITALLRAFWTDTAASPAQCAFARQVLAQRIGPHRLRLGFPFDGVRLAEKSGTFGALRHAVGVVEFPGEGPYAVAVFTRAARSDRVLPDAEAVIGAAARLAVDELRGIPLVRPR